MNPQGVLGVDGLPFIPGSRQLYPSPEDVGDDGGNGGGGTGGSGGGGSGGSGGGGNGGSAQAPRKTLRWLVSAA